MKRAVVFFLLFVTPFVFFPFIPNPFEFPKVILSETLTVLLLLLTIFSGNKTIRFRKEYSVAVIVLAGLSFIHLLFGQGSLTGNQFRLQGAFFLWILLLFSLLSARDDFGKTQRVIFFLLLIIQTLSVFLLGTDAGGRAVGTLGEPNSLAAAALVLWPFVFYGKGSGKRLLWLRVLSLAFVLNTIVLSGSRSGLIAFFIQLSFLFSASFLKLRTSFAVSICILLITLSLALPFFTQGGLLENRAEIWQAAAHAGWQSPIIGTGFGPVQNQLHEASWERSDNVRFQTIDSSHNIFLDWWIQAGFVGVVILLFFVGRTFQVYIVEKNFRNLVVLLALLVMFSFNPLSVPAHFMLWWLIGQAFMFRPHVR